MKRTLFLSLAIALATSIVRVAAQEIWAPPGVGLDEVPKATVSREIVSRLRVAAMNIILEETTMTEVRTRLGGTIGHRGDAGEYLAWLCFQGVDASSRWAIWIMSPEIQGGLVVGGFEWRRIAPLAQMDRQCATVPDTSRVELPIALDLGATEERIVKVLGEPTMRRGDVLVYVHHKETIRQEPYDATNIVAIQMSNGIVQAIEVWKSTVS